MTDISGAVSWCHHHKIHELIPMGGAYRVCGECGHVYATAADLVDAYNWALGEHGLEGLRLSVRRAETIAFCQECLGDF